MKIVLLGSGNVATHLALACQSAGMQVIQIWSKTQAHAAVLAARIDAEPIDDLSKIDQTAGLYIVAVKDDAIAAVAGALTKVTGLVVHTSGATALNVLASLPHYGVLYPLQTFSKAKAVDFTNVPLCIEAGGAEELVLLQDIAGKISRLIYKVDSERRKILHLAAVFACNFTNHLYHLSQLILEQHQLDFNLLKPLILETAEKIQGQELPAEVQTGPAVRGDELTMQKHLALLQGMPQLAEIYEILSRSIKKTQS